MRLAFSTNAYLNYSFDDAVTRLATIGYEGVEVMADVPHAWPAYMLPEQKAALRHSLERNNLAISNVNAFMMHAVDDPRQKYWHPSWIEPDPHYRALRSRHTTKAISLAKDLGAKCITTEPGGPIAPGESWKAGLDLFVETLKPVLEHAEREEVQLLVEPEPGLLIETAEQALEFMGRFDSPWLGLNFDIGHSYCVGEDPARVVPLLARYIRHVHLEDIASSRVHQHLLPGEGAIDFVPVVGALRSGGYDGWITVELYPYIENPDTVARLARERLLPILRAVGEIS
ncbi:MAG: sugar phosphate isomerase/epimerase [Planctomycetota bacterium]|nr:sugar phosphate isomerase/epimerase [Planctomycetota bacterium]RLS41058.1 MAG: sugar phosphate isomerase/epimerase [Planctomycetota bacterium]